MTEQIESDNTAPLEGEVESPNQLERIFNSLDQAVLFIESVLKPDEIAFVLQSEPLYRFKLTYLSQNRF